MLMCAANTDNNVVNVILSLEGEPSQTVVFIVYVKKLNLALQPFWQNKQALHVACKKARATFQAIR